MVDIHLIVNSLPNLLLGACVSIGIAITACGIGIVLGTLFGISYVHPSYWVRLPVGIYSSVLRGTPMLVQIMFMFYVLPQMGIHLPGFWCAVLAIGFNSSAHICQIVRTGINAVPLGQIEAAKTLGMSRWEINRYIILPQAFRIIPPALGNEFITLTKESSLASMIGVMELTKEASIIRSQTYDAFSILLAVSAIYLIMTTFLTLTLKIIEKRGLRYA